MADANTPIITGKLRGSPGKQLVFRQSYVELLYFIKDTYNAWRKTYDVSIAFATLIHF